jgi:hypothetical protein
MQPKDVVRRFVDEYQTGADERACGELLHPDVLDHSCPPVIASGARGVRQQFDGFRAAFPDFRATILDQIAEGDKVVTRKVFTGTHRGPLPGRGADWPRGRNRRHRHRPGRGQQDRRALELRRPARPAGAARGGARDADGLSLTTTLDLLGGVPRRP